MNVLVNEDSLKNIADAIRAKNNKTTLYKPGEMAAAIQAIEVGKKNFTVVPVGNETITVTPAGNSVSNDGNNYTLAFNDTVTATVSGASGYTPGNITVNGVDQGSSSVTLQATEGMVISATEAAEKKISFRGIYDVTFDSKSVTDEHGRVVNAIYGYDKANNVGTLNKNLLNSDELVFAGIDNISGQETFEFAGGKVLGDSIYIGIVQSGGNNFQVTQFVFDNDFRAYQSSNFIGVWARLFNALSKAKAEAYVLVSESEFTAEQALAAIAAHR